MRPYEIEQYLEKNKIFGDRILRQFTNYRTEWRNPATHDYNLSFDESEAFLAIVSVSAFTKLLVDEIAERLNFDAVQKDVAALPTCQKVELPSKPLIELVVLAMVRFPKFYQETHSSVPIESESQLMGALAGFLASTIPSAHTSTGRVLHAEKDYYIDMIITSGEQKVLVELKRGDSPSLVERGVSQLSSYLSVAKAKHGVLFLYSEKFAGYDAALFEDDLIPFDIYVVRRAR